MKTNKNGKWKEFNKHAILIAEGYYINDEKHGEWSYYYESGELAITETHLHGRLNGKYCSYYMSGQLMSEGEYQNDKREGEFKIYNEEGELAKILIFSKNVLIAERNLASAPAIISVGE